MIVRAALVNIGAGTTIVSSISRSLSIVTIMSMKTLWASMIVACSMAIVAITRLSLSLSIVTMSVASIVSMKTLGTSMSVADSMTIAITRFSFTLSIAITMSNVVTISVVGRVVTVTMVSLGHIDRG